MIKLSMNSNRREAIAMMPLLEYADNDHNFIDNPDYLELRNLLQKTLTETGPLILTTAAQATSLAQICERIADGCADNMGMFDSDGYYRRKFLTHNRMTEAIVKESIKAGWKVVSGGMSCIQITEDK